MNALKLLFVPIFFSSMIMNANARVMMMNCFNFSQTDIDLSFQSCVNRNFSEAGRELNLFLGHCSHFRGAPLSSFTSCVSNNMTRVGYKISPMLAYCFNYDGQRLSPSYTSCLNSNFRTIERELNKPVK